LVNVPVNEDHFKRYKASIDFTNFPKGHMAWWEAANEEEQENWYRGRFKCLKSHLYLAGFVLAEKPGDDSLEPDYKPILGMDFQENPHSLLFSRFVQKRPGEGFALSDLDNLTKKFMILWPRGLFKTSAVVVDIVQTILNYPNVRICFLTGGDLLAKRQLGRIKLVFEKPTKTFQFLFPEFCLESKLVKRRSKETGKNEEVWEDFPVNMGNAHEFTVPCRTNTTFAEPTFAISTARSVKAGSHFDLIFIDDLVNDQNYRSVKLLEKCYQDYLDICPLLEPTGFIVMTGTRYSFGDTYERIQEKAKEEEKQLGRTIWKFSIRDCWSLGCKNCPHTDAHHDRDLNFIEPPCGVVGCTCRGFQPDGSKGVLFPEARTHDGRAIGHSLEFLEGERVRLGPEFFANQYENSPIAAGTQVFTETLIGSQTLFDLSQFPSYSQSVTFAVADLAYVGQEGRDYSVIYLCRKYQGRIYVYDCEFGNWDSGAVATMVINLLLKHRPSIVYLERFPSWESYDRIIRAEAATRNIANLPIQWEKCSQVANAKLIRIGSIKSTLTGKRLWLYGLMKGYAQLVTQLTKWPKLGRHDDFADALGQVVNAPTDYQNETPPETPSTTNWLRKLSETAPVDDSYGDFGAGNGITCG
jgi:hypothetical protein